MFDSKEDIGVIYKIRGAAVGIEFTMPSGEVINTGPNREIFARRDESEEYCKFLPRFDSVDGYGVLDRVDRGDGEGFETLYVTSREFVFGCVNYVERLSRRYDRIQPAPGMYFARKTPVGLEFRTETTGFMLEYRQVYCDVNGKVVPFDENIFEISKTELTTLCSSDKEGVYIISGCITISKGNESGERDCMVARALFGSEDQIAVNAASVIANLITPLQGELTKQNLEDSLSEWFEGATCEDCFGSIMGAAVEKEQLRIVSTLLFGVGLADYLHNKRVTKVTLEDGKGTPWQGGMNLREQYEDCVSIDATAGTRMDALDKSSGMATLGEMLQGMNFF